MILLNIGNYLSMILDDRYVVENRWEKSVNIGRIDLRTELLITVIR